MTDASAWQPIETAPKDGKRIIVYVKNGLPEVLLAYWGVGKYDRRTKSYHHGWVTLHQNAIAPTHWQPLPPPPNTGDE